MIILPYPQGKQCAFTLTDDTDEASVTSVRTIYEYLNEIGIKATKTVWMYPCRRRSGNPEHTGRQCFGVSVTESDEYRRLLITLQKQGHEIALHLASGGNNLRSETVRAYEEFNQTFGYYPKININHGRNADTIYWCRDAFQRGFWRWITSLYTSDKSEGHAEESPYFWGDYCIKHTRYMRGYKSGVLNTLGLNNSMPFHDPDKPYVNMWFSATDLSEPWLLKRLLTKDHLDKLCAKRGACIGYIYLHKYVQSSNQIHPEFVRGFEILKEARGKCWFVPASTLLDRLLAIRKLKHYRFKGEVILENRSRDPLGDLWIKGNPGTVLRTPDTKKHVVGPSGLLNINTLSGLENGFQTDCSAGRMPGRRERMMMIIHQIGILLLRHLHGRKFRRQGW